MSVQLIVYPQNYEGQYNAFSTSATEALVNGINFTGLGSTTSYDSSAANTTLDVLTNEPPSIANTWYRFRTTSSGTPTLPTVTTGNLVLNSTTTLTLSGVYQRLTNLTVGQQYTFTINISTPAANGSIVVSAFNGTSVLTQQLFAASLSQITHSFTATSTDNTIMISYYNSVANNVTISGISIQPQGTSPNLTTFELEDGQVICDLYEDEDIPLSLSVDNFKNAAEKVQSYSKAFKLPATKRNNLIFDNMFEITRSDDGIIFNPYNKTECVLKQDGFILFKGYLKMLDINDKEGEISYNVNLYSEVVALADILKDRTFSELDFNELAHTYDWNNIKYSWNTSGTGITYLNSNTSGYRDANSTLKYPFIDWSGQVLISNGTVGVSINDYPELALFEDAFRPFIQIKYLINRIFAETPFTWESSFFDSADFSKLYMDFNWGEDEMLSSNITNYEAKWYAESVGGTTYSNYANTTFSPLELHNNPGAVGFFQTSWLPPNYNTSTHIITTTADGETYDITANYEVENIDTVDRTVDFRILLNGVPGLTWGFTIPAGGTVTYATNFGYTFGSGQTLVYQFKSDDATGTKVRQKVGSPNTKSPTSNVIFNVSAEAATTSTILQTLRGELGQWEFLKGIMTMFNLVSLPDEDNPNNIKFEPYGDIFIQNTSGTTLADRSIQHDWTDKVDVAEMKLTPLTDLNKNTIFKFVEDDDDFAFNLYKKEVGGHLYGSLKYDASLASNGLATVLQGEKEIIAEPFAATVIKPLFEQFNDFIVPAIFSKSDDETSSFDNSPRIMYDNGKKTLQGGISYYIPSQNGTGNVNYTEFLQFSHLTDIPTIVSSPPALTDTNDFHFGECQLLNGVGAATPRNLFNLYWLPYYKELYNPDTRTMTIKVNLSPSQINTFKFNDTIIIKNREFRVNKIDYKPNDLATVEFILIP